MHATWKKPTSAAGKRRISGTCAPELEAKSIFTFRIFTLCYLKALRAKMEVQRILHEQVEVILISECQLQYFCLVQLLLHTWLFWTGTWRLCSLVQDRDMVISVQDKTQRKKNSVMVSKKRPHAFWRRFMKS